MKVAIVHDWLTGMRGGEKVLEEILSFFPDAHIYTLLHVKGSVSEKIENHQIFQSYISKFPLVEKKYRNYLPFFPSAIESFNLNEYDLVISSSHCVAKGVIVPVNAPHLCYIHTPMRYAYEMYYHYFSKETTSALKRMIIGSFMPKLRLWDQATQSRVDAYAANSNFVAKRVKRYYGRDAEVINPPVDVEYYKPDKNTKKKDYFFMVSALEPYKRIDLAIEAFNMNGLPLEIAGKGSQYKTLKSKAKKNIRFLEYLSDDELRTKLRETRAFIFPGIEDFGITPVEAQACGTPVIAFGVGGALETVVKNKTGFFFDEQTPQSLVTAIDKAMEIDFNEDVIRKNSERFSKAMFRKNFQNFLKKHGGI